ncbi:membrane protein insertase YidC [Lewinellaceae bacterium SD302]|nr:membrane protein insertase YidC [Lewinellaceae bacterium SD302]
MDMDKRSMIGLFLILALFIVWQQVVAPSAEELEAQQRTQDSLAQVELMASQETDASADADSDEMTTLSDSARLARFGGTYGPFATALGGEERTVTLENDLMTVDFSTKGGKVAQVRLKEYQKMVEDEKGEIITSPLFLLDDERNRFEYLLPVSSVPSGGVNTGDLNFTATVEGQSVVFRAPVSTGGYFEQRYTLNDGTYLMDYDLRMEGLNNILTAGAEVIKLNWTNHLEKIEKNASYEANLSTVYYKPLDDDTDHCSCTGSDEEIVDGERLKWVANTQQFFTSALFSDNGFSEGKLETITVDVETSEDLKVLNTQLSVPFNRSASENIGMSFYVGPNEFDRMRAIGHDFSDVIPYGRSIFGAINRWIIRPIFDFLDNFVGNKGIAILLLTLLVKLMVYPLTYKMLVSNTKMQVLKPEIAKLKNKHGEDKQALQMETMKMYQEYGASPLGGCLPMVLQMPIWFALYRFFPAAITFRQESFLWATDLSSYDTFMKLPFSIPLGFGDHLSLFALLWAVTTLIYAFYNSRHMDFSAQPAMKYMQYLMPVMFLGFFNSFAAGLTCYLLFSNLFNIGQTIVTKEFIIDKDKLLTKLQANKKKPKKSGGFTARLQEALAEQQRQADKKGKKK